MLEIVNIESTWPLTMSSGDVRNDIAAILYAMTSLNTRFPVLGESSYNHFLQAWLTVYEGIAVSKIQKRMGEL